jgi:ribosome-associated heat shock protein Hsp15
VPEPGDRVRIDLWLWYARFFKTRGLATRAVKAGHVRVNGQRVRAAKEVRIGDRLDIVKGAIDYEIRVRAIPVRRGPALVARDAYEESPESVVKREAREAERRAVAAAVGMPTRGRPDKRTRRLLRARTRDA